MPSEGRFSVATKKIKDGKLEIGSKKLDWSFIWERISVQQNTVVI